MIVVSRPIVTPAARDVGKTIKITVWLVTRERATWMTAAEILGLALVLLAAPGPGVGLAVGFLLLAHLGYKALTSLPLGLIPGRPSAAKKERRNQDLRSTVVGFLNEVRRVEEHVQRAKIAGRSELEVEAYLRSAAERMQAAAGEVIKVTGRATPEPSTPGVEVRLDTRH